MMRYGAIASRHGTRREIGEMSAAGDQGKLRQHGEKLGSEISGCGNDRGASRGARRGRERDFHNRLGSCHTAYITCCVCTCCHSQQMAMSAGFAPPENQLLSCKSSNNNVFKPS